MVSPRALPVAAAAAVAALIVAVADPANALVRSTNVFASNRLRSAVPDPAFVFTPGAPANLRQLPFGSLSLGPTGKDSWISSRLKTLQFDSHR